MLASITIDVDAIRFYGAIHGLTEAQLPEVDPIYETALPRFFELLTEVSAAGTVFFIAQDVDRAGRRLTDGLATTGSELASHSFAHDYHLSRRPAAEIRADLEAAHRALSAVSETPVVGFRAPGYNTSPRLLRAVRDLGYQYDSSLLPSPVYWAARAAAIAGYTLLGRRSSSLVGDLRAYAGPRRPYRTSPDAPWRPRQTGPLIELPMAVDPLTRLPIIGTSWAVLPQRLNWAMLDRALRSKRPFVFEMHAIDLLDRTDPGVPRAIVEAQPDLRRPASDKIARFRALFRRLTAETELRPLRALKPPPPFHEPRVIV